MGESRVVLGIDPGLDGGLACLTLVGQCIHLGVMPVIGKKGEGKREIDGPEIVSWLVRVQDVFDIVGCAIEHVHAMPKQGVTSMFNFGYGYGVVRGILTAHHMKTILVPSTTWKKDVLTGTKRDKCAAISYCQRSFPNTDLIPERCRTPHDGMADALCIAEYCRRVTIKQLNAMEKV
jgi:crossover junction endodeoxyribonuclease RuvC